MIIVILCRQNCISQTIRHTRIVEGKFWGKNILFTCKAHLDHKISDNFMPSFTGKKCVL